MGISFSPLECDECRKIVIGKIISWESHGHCDMEYELNEDYGGKDDYGCYCEDCYNRIIEEQEREEEELDRNALKEEELEYKYL